MLHYVKQDEALCFVIVASHIFGPPPRSCSNKAKRNYCTENKLEIPTLICIKTRKLLEVVRLCIFVFILDVEFGFLINSLF